MKIKWLEGWQWRVGEDLAVCKEVTDFIGNLWRQTCTRSYCLCLPDLQTTEMDWKHSLPAPCNSRWPNKLALSALSLEKAWNTKNMAIWSYLGWESKAIPCKQAATQLRSSVVCCKDQGTSNVTQRKSVSLGWWKGVVWDTSWMGFCKDYKHYKPRPMTQKETPSWRTLMQVFLLDSLVGQ